jgi:hypothetical protein
MKSGKTMLNAASHKADMESSETDRIQGSIGAIGGKPRLKGKLLNAVFVLGVVGAFTMSLVTRGTSRMVFIDVGLLLLSLKLAYHLHTEAKVNHAQFWILATLEDRLLDVITELRSLRKELLHLSGMTQQGSLSLDSSETPTQPVEEE